MGRELAWLWAGSRTVADGELPACRAISCLHKYKCTKLHLFHPTLATTLAPLLSDGITIDHEYYVVGGLPVGTSTGIDHRVVVAHEYGEELAEQVLTSKGCARVVVTVGACP